MGFFKLKKTRSRVHPTQRYPRYAAIALLVALTGALIVVGVLKGRAQGRLAFGRQQLATQIQSNLGQATRTFEKMSLPGANVQGDILPAMKLHLFAAGELNKVMVETYGPQSSMIDQDIFGQIDLAIAQIARNIAEGTSPRLAQDTLSSYMTQMETDLNARFAGSDLLMSRGSLK
ncbi:hypothetical protein ACH6CV_16040 [Bacillota bacterium Meth-B3]|nr:hypothetical protein [Christensenellaceae bacterium]MEA5066074.1 hypothetical protein [Eubacteriales bacterium]MEA5067687.1 hypothetical protein [Christensenellaceae bacterium]